MLAIVEDIISSIYQFLYYYDTNLHMYTLEFSSAHQRVLEYHAACRWDR